MPTEQLRHVDLRILRLTLVRELETVNQYQEFFDLAEDPTVRSLMDHLIFEEKEHVAELTEMLKRFDTDQLSHFSSGHASEIGLAGVNGSTNQINRHDSHAPPRAAPNNSEIGSLLTVGSLYGNPQA